MATPLADFARYVRLEVPGCPEPIITDAILNSCIDFCTRTELLSEIVPLTVVPGIPSYAVTPTSTDHYPARLRAALIDTLPLGKTDAATYAALLERAESGTPDYYFAPTRNQITFAPVPNAADTVELDIVLRPDRDATSVDDVLYDEWATTIAMGAKAELMLKIGTPWANADLGTYYKTRYDHDVGTASVQVAAGNVGGAMRVATTEI